MKCFESTAQLTALSVLPATTWQACWKTPPVPCDRFFGTVIVFVPGDAARNYEFTSSLPCRSSRTGTDVEVVVGTLKVFHWTG